MSLEFGFILANNIYLYMSYNLLQSKSVIECKFLKRIRKNTSQGSQVVRQHIVSVESSSLILHDSLCDLLVLPYWFID